MTKTYQVVRRDVLKAFTGLAASVLLRPSPAAATVGEPFDFDILTRRMQNLAAKDYQPPEEIEGPLEDLTYDLYRLVAFDPEQARWQESGSSFRLHAFHPGWLFNEPVQVYEVVDGSARQLTFSVEDFRYYNEAADFAESIEEMPGVSGFRLHYPLNTSGVLDELVSFQGASYFRALGRDNAYGLSARGLAINTATEEAEEFPRFSDFYVVRPEPGDDSVVVFAALDSPSVTGAYRFVVTPGRETTMDVTARLFFRSDVAQLGVAPLTSMFLYSELNRSLFDDYRPQVHDSDGLMIRRGGGDRLWRSLGNPPRLATSYFAETSPTGFGLHQRDRAFASYEDPGADYHLRPSVNIEFLGEWGEGAVRLIEIPSDLEINDNIVAYWTPRGQVTAGEAREYRYRMRWGMLSPDLADDLAHVISVRTGVGGPSGVPYEGNARKFVIDFRGGRLPDVDGEVELEAYFAASRGTVDPDTVAIFHVPESGAWRLVGDVAPEGDDSAVELIAYLKVGDEKLTETWLYQWRPA